MQASASRVYLEYYGPLQSCEVPVSWAGPVVHHFGVGPALVAHLASQLCGEQLFADIFWDNEKDELAKKNIWLRERNGRWCLKICKHYNDFSALEVMEYTSFTDVERYLRDVLPAQPQGRIGIPPWNHLRLIPRAVISTTRLIYSRNSDVDLHVDCVKLDDRAFYLIGRLEVSSAKQLHEAAAPLMAAGLELQYLAPVRCKLFEYLYQRRRDFYDVLRSCLRLEFDLTQAHRCNEPPTEWKHPEFNDMASDDENSP